MFRQRRRYLPAFAPGEGRESSTAQNRPILFSEDSLRIVQERIEGLRVDLGASVAMLLDASGQLLTDCGWRGDFDINVFLALLGSQMNALIFDGQLKLVHDYPMPRIPQGEALVRVLRAGICNTDLEIIKGYMGYRGVLGHEFIGVVQDGEMRGARVVGEINADCGACPTCLRGDTTHCPNRTTLGIVNRDGALAEYLTLPTRNLHRVPDWVFDAQAVFTEPLAAACEITDRIHIRPTDRVCVIGDGKLGLLCAQVLQLSGCDLLTIGRHASKLTILQARGIATTTDADTVRGQFDVVVDCTGNAGGFDLARKLTRPRGTLVLKSTFHGGQESSFAPIVVDEISIIGSRCGPFVPALRLLEQKLIDVDLMIDSEFPIEHGMEAFERARQKGALKVQVTC